MTPRETPDPTRAGTHRWALALVVWVAFIWGHSLMSGGASSAESLSFVNATRGFFELIGVTETLTMTFIVRKTAHLLEYTVLGVIAGGLMRRGWG
ncbi:MAG: VanZ family protein, partial [Olsenella sp.]